MIPVIDLGLSLPCFPELSDDDVDAVARAVGQACEWR